MSKARSDIDAENVRFARERIAILCNTSGRLRGLAAEPIPPGLDMHQTREAAKYSRWLQRASEEVEALASLEILAARLRNDLY